MIKIVTGSEKVREEEKRGLDAAQVAASRAANGENKLSRAKRKSFFRQFLGNLSDPIIKILIAALVINLIFTFRNADWVETVGIAVSILLATFISTMSEYGAGTAFERLESAYGRQKCRVLRKQGVCEIDIEEIVVGDLVYIGAGEQIPADGVLIEGDIACDQSAMTGESREVYKKAAEDGDRIESTPDSPFFCLRGCTVLSGEGMMRVESVGDRTFIGGISREIQTDTRESPLKIRLAKLARQISTVGYVAAALIALVYLFNVFAVDSAFDTDIIKYKITDLQFLASHLIHALTLGLTVIVVAVPEGLPMMIAVVLSSNIKKMVKDQVLVRKPVGIESAGSMNILFTDKTGTLTEGKMSVSQIYLGNGESFEGASALSKTAVFHEYLLSALGNTTSRLSAGNKRSIGGNSTDKAILESVIGREKSAQSFSVVKNIPFDSEKKFSAALLSVDGARRLFVKGAPEKLLPCVREYLDGDGHAASFSSSVTENICKALTEKGKRVLMIAESKDNFINSRLVDGDFGELTMICLVVLEDRVRKTAKGSVNRLRGAGVQVVMITGDNKETARHIAAECGILGGGIDTVLTGGELAHLSDSQLKEILPRLGVVARALPADKSRLVRISQELDLVVGMTGDGINDAPALKRADVGFAMGSGTQVAKDAGDIIILDNNLASIAKAVLYGRNIFKSIRKFITLQLVMNFCAVGVSMICPFLGYDAPVTVVQMLWINIIMDTLGGLAFAGEPALESCMEEKPKRRDEPILNGYMVYEILVGGGFTIALCIAFLKLPEITSRFRFAADNIYLLTAFFALFIFSSVFNCFCARTDRLRLLANITRNKTFIAIMAMILAIQIGFIYLGGAVLRTAPLTLSELGITSLVALLVFPADLIRKLVWRALAGKRGY
ncbi:MAG: calcium-translocating P-type ATPase, PMCA-type [Clostridia bacterium]|nr:calcium-translocating P-type ATPase, PMCA-type [Clostridia bacterium]